MLIKKTCVLKRKRNGQLEYRIELMKVHFDEVEESFILLEQNVVG